MRQVNKLDALFLKTSLAFFLSLILAGSVRSLASEKSDCSLTIDPIEKHRANRKDESERASSFDYELASKYGFTKASFYQRNFGASKFHFNIRISCQPPAGSYWEALAEERCNVEGKLSGGEQEIYRSRVVPISGLSKDMLMSLLPTCQEASREVIPSLPSRIGAAQVPAQSVKSLNTEFRLPQGPPAAVQQPRAD